jgi:predicted acylesterase/phospholipase RssA
VPNVRSSSRIFSVSLYFPAHSLVCAQSAHTTRANIPVLFRTYDGHPHEPVATCKIWEAARATSAAPTFFKGIEIGREAFVDGGMGRNNPTSVLVEEAEALFPERPFACVVSIGTGQVPSPGVGTNPPLSQRLVPTKVIRAVVEMATDCEETHENMMKLFTKNKKNNVYFRFNVPQGLQDIKLGEWKRLPEVRASTSNYIKSGEAKVALEQVVQVLKEPVGMIMAVAQMDDIR